LIVVRAQEIRAGVLILPVFLIDPPEERNRCLVLGLVEELDGRSERLNLVGGRAHGLRKGWVISKGWGGEVEVLESVDVPLFGQGLLRRGAQARRVARGARRRASRVQWCRLRAARRHSRLRDLVQIGQHPARLLEVRAASGDSSELIAG